MRAVTFIGSFRSRIAANHTKLLHLLIKFDYESAAFENVNPDLMVKGKKEMTNVKDVLHKNLTFPLITYLLS